MTKAAIGWWVADLSLVMGKDAEVLFVASVAGVVALGFEVCD